MADLIEENGITRELSSEAALQLSLRGLLYKCQEPQCPGHWHITPTFTWRDIDRALVELQHEEQGPE